MTHHAAMLLNELILEPTPNRNAPPAHATDEAPGNAFPSVFASHYRPSASM